MLSLFYPHYSSGGQLYAGFCTSAVMECHKAEAMVISLEHASRHASSSRPKQDFFFNLAACDCTGWGLPPGLVTKAQRALLPYPFAKSAYRQAGLWGIRHSS